MLYLKLLSVGPVSMVILVRVGITFSLYFFLLISLPVRLIAQMVTGAKMPGYAEAFGLNASEQAADYTVQEIAVKAGSDTMANVLLPDEKLVLTYRFTNKTKQRLHAHGMFQLIRYQTAVAVGDIWVPHVSKLAEEGVTLFEVNLAPEGFQDVTVRPAVPERFGGYVLIADLTGHGRAFASALVRSIQPDTGRVQYPTYALDATWPQYMNEGVLVLFEKLGIKGMRLGASYAPESAPEYMKNMQELDRYMQWVQKHDVTAMLTLDNGSMTTQPLGRPRPWLSSESKMLKTKSDMAWLPSYDKDFQDWVQRISTNYGWPKGNVNAVELWNEPWESISISGWGADIPRYQEIFTHMALGVEAARAKAGVKVLIGGTCSSSNARDKLFADGTDKYLKWLDFVSVHYQMLSADPSEVPEWMNRKSEYGPVRVWDTESWIANSEDRVAGVIASMRAQGQSRTAGVYGGNVYDSHNVRLDGQVYPVVQAWVPAAAVAATQKFIGQRAFNRLLFQNGLPWIFVFDGISTGEKQAQEEDGTVVVLGDLKALYDPNRTVFRSVKLLPDAELTVSNQGHFIRAYDFYGNEIQSDSDTIHVPLNGRGYFLRGDGRIGSFARLLAELKNANVTGYTPVEIIAHDMMTPVDQGSTLRLSLTNILNRPVTGQIHVALEGLKFVIAHQTISLAANETKDILFSIANEKPVASNTYNLSAEFDGIDGHSVLREEVHVNQIAHRTIQVDGDLADWRGVLPQVMPGSGIGVNMTEEAWLPFTDFSQGVTNGISTVYLAYDDTNFYFAAKISDTTSDPGMLRFAKRDDDSYFYPDRAEDTDGKMLTWPANTRHYSYRKHFDVPSGSGEHDNVQIAFNVLKDKPWLPHPLGVMPHFITYWDTDYEYALNPIADTYGGGAEIWRLQSPGMPRKHFFPRQPRSPVDGGPVTGQLVIRRQDNTRLVEAAIPWSEMPAVRALIAAGKPVKFTCRVNDNKGPAHELAADRSVSITNSITFHDDWKTHWANELEFSAEQ
ncbi:DOMON domain-containing protein [Edaphobacter flagellatus]|uniref:hypothetical protein n=1 Tax=Edaphobacter flagellatus TaxID=1933044 RepID=UPI0021B25068|nr:hypothetical protein [Edaphobacter flagellatus]